MYLSISNGINDILNTMDKDKVAVVTGASTGIGRAIALELAKSGYSVFLVARSSGGLAETFDIITKAGGRAEIFTCDLAKTELVENLIKGIKAKTGQVDVLVNVAGVWHGKDEVYSCKDFETFSQDVILDTFFVGLISPTLLAHALVPLMPRNGKLVNISGTFENGAKGWLPYLNNKKGIEDLTIGLAEELREKGVQVNPISPSDTATEAYGKYFPQYMSEAIEPSEIAKQVVYLCSEKANDITGKVFVMKKGQKPYEGYHS